ncbi:MAG TPA: SDR family NAD(P)-dependent oxidoreductase [Paracoccus solventivorans]|uniref:NAD-dependent epimerase/dehydratase family protein n=1 Tax=Paracoccus solventivorans TaxID=53463 RepID=UPI002C622307|nr:NAD-dependent epimerase/dehydratase family protein [Paracoccus solventivorans]HMM08262.1 SDR family NAD(P)-dependent oxidoreductase [Paracoccus solventivorans]
MSAFSGRHLLLVGPGYAARAVAGLVIAAGGSVSAAIRDPARAEALAAEGIRALALDADGRLDPARLAGGTDLLVSAPPTPEGCPGLRALGEAWPPSLRWIGYYSSTAVYGDCGGEWIDETRAPAPRTADAKGRLTAEAAWTAAARRHGAALDILRIAGIYGPGTRNVLGQLRSGTARAIVKPGQVFNRIHRDDIAAATLAAMRAPDGVRLTNLADGAPSPASEVLAGVARMLGLPEPPAVAFDKAGLPPGAAGFYAENRRIRADRLAALPGFRLAYPDWRAGYAAILASEGLATAPA